MVDFAPASEVVPGRYDSEEVFNTVLPHLKQLKAAGGHSLVECTPNFLARDPTLLRRLSESSGIHLVTNTGLYKEPHLPQFALEETEDELVERWVKEAEEGLDGTGIRPGFIKTAVPNETPFPPTNDKLIRVAARVHLRTGLPIVTHCTAGEAMVEILKILEEESVPASAWIWAHADSVTNTRYHLKAARKGAWIEFDTVGRKPLEIHLELIQQLTGRGFINRLLLSHDAGWYTVGEIGGGEYVGYDTIYTRFVPLLKRSGFNQEEIDQLLQSNPAEAFVRR